MGYEKDRVKIEEKEVNTIMTKNHISIIILLILAITVFVTGKPWNTNISGKTIESLTNINETDPVKDPFVDKNYTIVYDKTYGVNIVVYPTGQQHIYFDVNGNPLDALDVLNGKAGQ